MTGVPVNGGQRKSGVGGIMFLPLTWPHLEGACHWVEGDGAHWGGLPVISQVSIMWVMSVNSTSRDPFQPCQ